MRLPRQLEGAVEMFRRLPGVGEKTALRYALEMTTWSVDQTLFFTKELGNLIDLKRCDECGYFCDTALCSVCSQETRLESGIVCVVENVANCLAVEKSGVYKGVYHVLGGVINPFLGIGPEELTIEKLLERIEKHSLKEVILALNPSIEGDVTSAYLRDKLDKLPHSLIVRRIGLGVPMGGSLEHLDSLTILKALENRRSF
jgi:recombination protein RecR